MGVVLQLPPEMEAQLAKEAAQKGLKVPDYLLRIIEKRETRLSSGLETYVLSESALAKDWLRPEEDEAWQHL